MSRFSFRLANQVFYLDLQFSQKNLRFFKTQVCLKRRISYTSKKNSEYSTEDILKKIKPFTTKITETKNKEDEFVKGVVSNYGAAPVLRRDFTPKRSTLNHAISEKLNWYQENREFKDLTYDTFAKLAVDKETKHQIALILHEYEYLKYRGDIEMPNTITVENMRYLLTLNTPLERERNFSYLFKKEIDVITKVLKKEKIKEKLIIKNKEKYANIKSRIGIFQENGEIVYGLWHNSLFTKVKATKTRTTGKLVMSKLRTASQFGQKLVIDMSYLNNLNNNEIDLTLKQCALTFDFNRVETIEAFDLHFCGLDKTNDMLTNRLHVHFQILQSPTKGYLLQLHEKPFYELFPKNKLVYLIDDAEPLTEYDHDAIYVLGAAVQKNFKVPWNSQLTKRENIAVKKLPLNMVSWGTGGKRLCLNHIIGVLNDVKFFGDWKGAIERNTPKRKLKDPELVAFEEMTRILKLKDRFHSRIPR